MTTTTIAPEHSDRREGEDRRQQDIAVANDRRQGDRRGGRPRRDDARRERWSLRLSEQEIIQLRRVAAQNHQTPTQFMVDAISDAIADCSDDEPALRTTHYTPRKSTV